jgi:hypothetical protein
VLDSAEPVTCEPRTGPAVRRRSRCHRSGEGGDDDELVRCGGVERRGGWQTSAPSEDPEAPSRGFGAPTEAAESTCRGSSLGDAATAGLFTPRHAPPPFWCPLDRRRFPTPDQLAANNRAADAVFRATLPVRQAYHGRRPRGRRTRSRTAPSPRCAGTSSRRLRIVGAKPLVGERRDPACARLPTHRRHSAGRLVSPGFRDEARSLLGERSRARLSARTNALMEKRSRLLASLRDCLPSIAITPGIAAALLRLGESTRRSDPRSR